MDSSITVYTRHILYRSVEMQTTSWLATIFADIQLIFISFVSILWKYWTIVSQISNTVLVWVLCLRCPKDTKALKPVLLSGGVYGDAGRMQNLSLSLTARWRLLRCSREVCQPRMHPHCSELQRNTVSVSLCCITDHPKVQLRTFCSFSWLYELDAILLCQFCLGSLKQLHQVEDQPGPKVEMAACVGRDAGCWLGCPSSLPFGLSSSRVDYVSFLSWWPWGSLCRVWK